MISRGLSGATRIAGVVGRPVDHSLSPLIHNAWIAALGLDAVYVPFSPPADRFLPFIEGLRGGVLLGLNVTLPFKEQAVLAADARTAAAGSAGAANLLIFSADGRIEADNTDGAGLLHALRRQAPDLKLNEARTVLLGAGGAARGAVSALRAAGVPHVTLLNRTRSKAERLAALFPGVEVGDPADPERCLRGAALIVNASSAELVGGASRRFDLGLMAPGSVALDMNYRPVATAFLDQARTAGLTTVDGLEMLIGQAAPSFTRLFGCAPPALDVRALALEVLERGV